MTERELWIPAEATVTSCQYQFARMNTFTFGIQTGDKFRISFDYTAHGQLYSDEFQSPVAVPQNTTLPLSYNPLMPRENSLSAEAAGTSTGRNPLLAIGIAGSVVLSLIWLAMLRGCQ